MKKRITVRAVLARALVLLRKRKGWVQGAWAGKGTFPLAGSCYPGDREATCFCLTGAVERAVLDLTGSTALYVKQPYGLEFYEDFDTVTSFNDDAYRTKAEVLRVLERAIASC